MSDFKDLIQSADWKQEKHVPVIDVSEKNKKKEDIKVTIKVGKEIPHPNTTEHHIRWIAVYFQPHDEKFPYQIGLFEFSTHGESIQGPNTSTVFTQPEVVCHFISEKSGTIFATSYCNIHGLWKSEKEISVS